MCPLCRQLANSVLPLSPQLGDKAQMVRSRPSSMTQVLDEISDFLKENDQKPVRNYFKTDFRNFKLSISLEYIKYGRSDR